MGPIPDLRVTTQVRRLLLLSCCTAALVLSAQAKAQTSLGMGLGNGVQSATSLGGGLVNLRDLVNSPTMEPARQPLTIGGALGLFGGYTDNVNLSSTGSKAGTAQRGSPMERVQPALDVGLDVSTVQASLHYAPMFQFYNDVGKANQVQQSLSSNLKGEFIPDTLFVNANAFASQASTSQLATANGANGVASNALSQVYSFGINPYLQHRFASYGTAQLGYSLSNNIFDNSAQKTSSNSSVKNTNSATQSEYLNLTSGEEFGAFNHSIAVSAAQYTGSNTQQDGHRNQGSYTLGYALNRFVTVVGQVGYEDLFYGATSFNGSKASQTYSVKGPTGQGGFKLTPNDDSSLSVGYGRMDGANSLSLDGVYKPTPRLAVLASSSSGVTTNGQDLSNFVNSSSFGTDGSARSAGGAPLAYSLGSANGSNQPYRLTRSSLNAVYSADRDSFSLGVSATQQKPVSAVGLYANSSTSTIGTIGWQHDVSELMKSSVSASYGTQSSSAAGGNAQQKNPVAGIQAQLSRALSENLNIELDYTFARQRVLLSGLTNKPVQSMNQILLGLVQKF